MGSMTLKPPPFEDPHPAGATKGLPKHVLVWRSFVTSWVSDVSQDMGGRTLAQPLPNAACLEAVLTSAGRQTLRTGPPVGRALHPPEL